MRPSDAILTATTPGGVRFQYDLETVRARGARDAANRQLLALVAWTDAPAFCREVTGYTTWTVGESMLRRTLPLQHPIDPEFYCDEYDLADYGAYESRADFAKNPPGDTTPAQDWCRYLLTFVRPPFEIRSDETMAILYPGMEQARYTTLARMPRPRERVVSGMGYEYSTDGGVTWQPITDERQFIPDYQIDLALTWREIPEAALPDQAIHDALITVNEKPIKLTLGGRQWFPGELLFKGLAKPIEVYTAANGERMYDVVYLFTFQPGTWNKYLTRAAGGGKFFAPVRIRGGAGAGFPPYPSFDFQKLFVPG